MRQEDLEQLLRQKLELLESCDTNFEQLLNDCKVLLAKAKAQIDRLPESEEKQIFIQKVEELKKLGRKTIARRKVVQREKERINISMQAVIRDSLSKTPKGNLRKDIYDSDGRSLVYTQAIRQYKGDLQKIIKRHLYALIAKDPQLVQAYSTLGAKQIKMLENGMYHKCLDAMGAGNCGESSWGLMAEVVVMKGLMLGKKFRYVTRGSFSGNHGGVPYDHAFNVLFNLVNGQPDTNEAAVADKWTSKGVSFTQFMNGANPYGTDFTVLPAKRAVTIRWNHAQDLFSKGEAEMNMGKIYVHLLRKTTLIETCKNEADRSIKAGMKKGKIKIRLKDGSVISSAIFIKEFKALKQAVKNGQMTENEAMNKLAQRVAGIF